MKSSRKRKPQESKDLVGSLNENEPYPTFPRPTPEECRSIRDILLNLHGFPEEFAKYRTGKRAPNPSSSSPLLLNSGSEPSNEVIETEKKLVGRQQEEEEEAMAVESQKESVLDGLVSTLLSQNTTEINSTRAFASLKSAFPTWEDVRDADLKCIERAIKCGGLAVTKASCIKNLLTSLLEKRGKLCLEYLQDMSVDEIKQELQGFKGIGPKTVACVLMFHLHRDDFPVDTHVFRITKDMGWIPANADREKAYLHLNRRIPNYLKFDLNCLLVTHGKVCPRCTKKNSNKHSKISHNHTCPLSNYCSFTDLKELT